MTPSLPEVLALDIGGTKTAAAVVSAPGIVSPVLDRPTPTGSTAEIEELVVEALAVARARGHGPVAIGLSVAGLVGLDRSTVALAPNLPLRQHPLGRRVRELTGLATVVENDVNAAGWGEFLALDEPAGSLLVVMLGTGLGGAYVADGRLVRGASGLAMEVGHLGFAADGPPCGCGRRGCWEQYASGTALVRDVRARLAAGERSALGAVRDPDGGDVHVAADAGDPVAVGAFARLGTALGQGLADLVTLVNPSVVVLGGGVARASRHFLEPALEALGERLGPGGGFLQPDLRVSGLGPRGALLGVADLATSGMTNGAALVSSAAPSDGGGRGIRTPEGYSPNPLSKRAP